MSDCFCDYDPPEFWSRRISTARKPHRCSECEKPITRGEKYEAVAGKWEGYFDTFKTCDRCLELRQWVTNNLPCFCWAHGNMIDDAKSIIEEVTQRVADETKGLRFGFLRKLHAVERHRVNA